MIRLDHVSKVFGPARAQALCALAQGAGKARIRRVLGATVALDDVSLSVEAGELFAVMGLSGSGKSTLVRLVNGLIAPDRGDVRVDGTDISRLSGPELVAFRRARLSMVFQSFALFPHRTVAQNAAFGLEVQGVDAAQRLRRAGDWLSRVGLEGYADAYPHELSGGMKQRVGLARALAVEAPVMLMDEPFSALDPATRADLQDLLLSVQAELGRTIVFVTHDFAEAARLASRIAIMDAGRLVQADTPDAILRAPATPGVAALTAPAAAQAARRRAD